MEHNESRNFNKNLQTLNNLNLVSIDKKCKISNIHLLKSIEQDKIERLLFPFLMLIS